MVCKKVYATENGKKIIVGNYSEELLDYFESQESGLLFLEDVGLVIGKTPEDYELAEELRKVANTNKFFFLFFFQNIPIIVCSEMCDLEFAKERMKRFGINYLLSLENDTLYFYGILLNIRFVNNLRKKLKMEVLRLHEIRNQA